MCLLKSYAPEGSLTHRHMCWGVVDMYWGRRIEAREEAHDARVSNVTHDYYTLGAGKALLRKD